MKKKMPYPQHSSVIDSLIEYKVESHGLVLGWRLIFALNPLVVASSLRVRYAKTSVPVPAVGRPKGFQSVFDTYSWPDRWLQCVAQRYGEKWLCRKLEKWSWSLSTAFSGVGAAESVLRRFYDSMLYVFHLLVSV